MDDFGGIVGWLENLIERTATHGVLWIFIIMVFFKVHSVSKQVAAVGRMLGHLEDKFDKRFGKVEPYA